MKVFLIKTNEPDRVHGRDYLKGLVDKDENVIRECGWAHEYQTRQCRPIFLTEEEVERLGFRQDEIVEAVPFAQTPLDMMLEGAT